MDFLVLGGLEKPVVELVASIIHPGTLILGYLYYEFHHGRVDRLLDQWETIQPMILAMALVVDGVDEQMVNERLEVDEHEADPYIAGPLEVVDWHSLSTQERQMVEEVVQEWREGDSELETDGGRPFVRELGGGDE